MAKNTENNITVLKRFFAPAVIMDHVRTVKETGDLNSGINIPKKKEIMIMATKKVVKITDAKKKPAKKAEPEKTASRRLTNKERDAVSSALTTFMIAPGFNNSSELGKLLVSALEKIRVK